MTTAKRHDISAICRKYLVTRVRTSRHVCVCFLLQLLTFTLADSRLFLVISFFIIVFLYINYYYFDILLLHLETTPF